MHICNRTCIYIYMYTPIQDICINEYIYIYMNMKMFLRLNHVSLSLYIYIYMCRYSCIVHIYLNTYGSLPIFDCILDL